MKWRRIHRSGKDAAGGIRHVHSTGTLCRVWNETGIWKSVAVWPLIKSGDAIAEGTGRNDVK